MHVEAEGTVRRDPALLGVIRAPAPLRSRLQGGLAELETGGRVGAGRGRVLVRALRAEGLIEAAGPRNLDHYSGGTNVFGSNGGQGGHPCDRRKSVVGVS